MTFPRLLLRLVGGIARLEEPGLWRKIGADAMAADSPGTVYMRSSVRTIERTPY